MPIYEYQCEDCGQEFELLVRSDTKLECPTCQSTSLEKQLSVFATTAGQAQVPVSVKLQQLTTTCPGPEDTSWTPIDPILSVLVALLILRGAWTNLLRAWHVLMEGTPEGLDVAALRAELAAAVPGVLDVHHVHAWSLVPGRTVMTLHASIAELADHDRVLRGLQRLPASW